MTRPSVAQSLASQHRILPMVVMGGLDGARLVFAGGPDLEVAGRYATTREAQEVRGMVARMTAHERLP